MTGLGGAYTALGEGVEGSTVNAASPGVRDAFSLKWIDFDFSLGFSFLGSFANTDFDNHGGGTTPHARVGDFVDLNFGARLQVGPFGVCATGDLSQYSIKSVTAAPNLTLQLGRWRALAAYGLLRGQLIVGGGVRVATMQILQNAGLLDPRVGRIIPGGQTLFTMTGVGAEIGALLMPDGQQFRIGATFRSTVSGTASGSDGASQVGLFLPGQVVLPWEAELGFAYQLGPRPLNPTWLDPRAAEAAVRERVARDREKRADAFAIAVAKASDEAARANLRAIHTRSEGSLQADEEREIELEKNRLLAIRKARYQNWPREKILVLASLLLTGQSDNAVSLAGFLDQKRELVGQSLTLTPRLGLEGEPIPNRVVARVGTYVEPTRYSDSFARQHFTFGGDVKLFDFDVWGAAPDTTWKIGIYLDVAPRYTNGGIGIGAWH